MIWVLLGTEQVGDRVRASVTGALRAEEWRSKMAAPTNSVEEPGDNVTGSRGHWMGPVLALAVGSGGYVWLHAPGGISGVEERVQGAESPPSGGAQP
jgi:hypothetical protein